jgi:hypothetical protein
MRIGSKDQPGEDHITFYRRQTEQELVDHWNAVNLDRRIRHGGLAVGRYTRGYARRYTSSGQRIRHHGSLQLIAV